MRQNIDLTTIKNFIYTNSLSNNVMLMLHPSNYSKLATNHKNNTDLICVSGINVIVDNDNEVNENEIDVLEVKFN